jgi:hypothetical protein
VATACQSKLGEEVKKWLFNTKLNFIHATVAPILSYEFMRFPLLVWVLMVLLAVFSYFYVGTSPVEDDSIDEDFDVAQYGDTVYESDYHGKVYLTMQHTNRSHCGVMTDVLQLVVQQGWIQPSTLSLNTDMHTQLLHALPTKLHICSATGWQASYGSLLRPEIMHLSIDESDSRPGGTQNAVTHWHLRSLTRLQSLSITNVRQGTQYSAALQTVLAQLPATCTSIEISMAREARNARLQSVVIPPQVQALTVCNVDWRLPLNATSQLTVLTIDSCDSSTMQLPESLRELYVKNTTALPQLPHTLSVLDLTESGFTGSLVNLIPAGLKTLKLPKHYNNSIGTLPIGLQHLDVGLRYMQQLEVLPTSLTHFIMKREATCSLGLYQYSLAELLPDSLKVLRVSSLRYSLGALPTSLSELYYSCCDRALRQLPPSLTVLHIDSIGFNSSLKQLPAALCELNLSRAYAFNKPLGTLPVSLQKLYLHTEYAQQLEQLPAAAVCIRQSLPDHAAVRSALHAAVAAAAAARGRVVPVDFNRLLVEGRAPHRRWVHRVR